MCAEPIHHNEVFIRHGVERDGILVAVEVAELSLMASLLLLRRTDMDVLLVTLQPTSEKTPFHALRRHLYLKRSFSGPVHTYRTGGQLFTNFAL
jgi:hypothetical protein